MTNRTDYAPNRYEKHLEVIGQALEEFMHDTGCRTAQLAKLIGISRTTLGNIVAFSKGNFFYASKPQKHVLAALKLIPMMTPVAMRMLDELDNWESYILTKEAS